MAIGLCVAAAPQTYADTLYASTAFNGNVGDFGTLDTVTGVYTPLGDNGVTLAGLGAFGANLYGAIQNNASGNLYRVNPSNGSLTLVGNSGIAYSDFAVAAGGLWAFGVDNNLYSINASTGAATLIGPTGLNSSFRNSLASGLGSLFLYVQATAYTLNPTTGAATFVGCSFEVLFGQCSGEPFDAMASSGGVLYGLSENTGFGDRIYTINTSTGYGTYITETGPNQATIFGISAAPQSQSPTPEPGTLSLLVAAGACLLGLRDLRRRKLM